METDARTIMLVDDDPDIIFQLTMLLEREGYVVRAAATAAEAEELLLSVRPDLAIIDLMMEEKDSGFVLCHQIKKLYPGAPVIMLTAVKAATGMSFVAKTADERSWLEADALVDKPVRSEKMLAEVRRLLNRPETARKTGD